MRGIVKKLSIVAFVAALGAAGTALAHSGWGAYGSSGRMMGPGYGSGMMGQGYGNHMMGPGMMGYGPHMGRWGDRGDFDLSAEQTEQLEAARETFYRDTRGLRDQIYDRSTDLRRELSRENPDHSRVRELQQALSELESELDQKALAYRLELRKIAPGFGNGFARAGDGPGAGYCWR